MKLPTRDVVRLGYSTLFGLVFSGSIPFANERENQTRRSDNVSKEAPSDPAPLMRWNHYFATQYIGSVEEPGTGRKEV